MNPLLVAIALGAVVCAGLGALIGSNKNAAGTGFALGLLFGPLGVIAALALDQRRACPKCSGRIDGAPEVCRHCGAALSADPGRLQTRSLDDDAAEAEYIRRLRERRGQ